MAQWKAVRAEEVCQSKKLAKVSPIAEALWYRLLVASDDFGLYTADAETVKTNLYRWGNRTIKEIESALKELADIELILVYQVNSNEPCLMIVKHDALQTSGLLRGRTKPRYDIPPGYSLVPRSEHNYAYLSKNGTEPAPQPKTRKSEGYKEYEKKIKAIVKRADEGMITQETKIKKLEDLKVNIVRDPDLEDEEKKSLAEKWIGKGLL